MVGSTQLSNVTLDNANHPLNPLDNGDKDLRWFLQTIDNSNGTQPYTFQLIFDTIVTGRTRTQPTRLFYTTNCCLANADNDAFIGWYDRASGYNGQGFASESFNKVADRRSPEADGDVTIRQPLMTLTKGVDQAELSADGVVTFTLLAANMGNSEAFDLVIEDKLPEGLTLLATASTRIIYPIGFPSVGTNLSDANAIGAQSLRYDLDVLYVGAVLEIVYTARVDSAISADLTLNNIATVTSYSSLRGTQANERTYTGPTASVELSTPMGSIAKSDQVDEVTQGATIVYTLTVPSTPIDATLYKVIVHDEVPSQLSIQSVTGGVFTGNSVEAVFDAILPHEQREIVITALVKEDSKGGRKSGQPSNLELLERESDGLK